MTCPKCGAAESYRERAWRCGSIKRYSGSVWQSDACRIAELQAEVARLQEREACNRLGTEVARLREGLCEFDQNPERTPVEKLRLLLDELTASREACNRLGTEVARLREDKERLLSAVRKYAVTHPDLEIQSILDAARKEHKHGMKCQVCGTQNHPLSLFDAKDITGVKCACVSCIEKAARISAAKEMRERAAKAAEEGPLDDADYIAAAIRALPIEGENPLEPLDDAAGTGLG